MNPLILEGSPGRTAIVQGKEYLFFSGYGYLGVNHIPAFTALVKEGIDKYGLLFPSSRISNTRLALFAETEALLSSITGSEDTVLFSSGFTAGRAVVSLYPQLQHAPGAHPAIQANSSAYKSFTEWSNVFVASVNSAQTQAVPAFAADSINVLTATLNDFSFLAHLQQPGIAIIDDSHGMGLIGTDGKGIASLMPLLSNIDYHYTYSLSKAFGIIGGAVSCSKASAALLRNHPSYTAGTSISPASLYAFTKAQGIYRQQRDRLQENMKYFQELSQQFPSIQFHPQLPIFILPETIDEELLLHKGIIVSSFAYPDVHGKKIKRIVLNALHIKEDLDYLFGLLQEQL